MLLLDATFAGIISDAATTITSLFGIITGNWLLLGILGVSVVIPLVFSLFSYLKNR